ncbi:MarR family winged helix-turn-helix transcriptional regulator [Pandoraea sp. ISTKB]|uniref:MarR family winged helix-turn-helix transcriptional regulator n=1 Tax=Pandoraea sp. ISTKB TaxID=1586708 RepID=UPI00084798E6|nr:MarR family transcriptional regulator [Pandoraea sp. ISTKB]ODP35107.1 hypothetical protein A9762_12145 [Pandoraea sp. ISTKB]
MNVTKAGDQAITSSLQTIMAGLRRHAWEGAGRESITPTQGEVLVLLAGGAAGNRVSDIAREMQLTVATVSCAISTLESKGLVVKRRGSADGRSKSLGLTAAGRRAANRAAKWPRFIDEAVGKMSTRERAQFTLSLTKLAASVAAG